MYLLFIGSSQLECSCTCRFFSFWSFVWDWHTALQPSYLSAASHQAHTFAFLLPLYMPTYHHHLSHVCSALYIAALIVHASYCTPLPPWPAFFNFITIVCGLANMGRREGHAHCSMPSFGAAASYMPALPSSLYFYKYIYGRRTRRTIYSSFSSSSFVLALSISLTRPCSFEHLALFLELSLLSLISVGLYSCLMPKAYSSCFILSSVTDHSVLTKTFYYSSKWRCFGHGTDVPKP